MDYIKRGDDFQFLAKSVHSRRTQALLPSATVAWRLITKGGAALGAGSTGNMTQYDVDNNHFEAFVPRALTATLDKYGQYVLEIVVTNSGLQTTKQIELTAVDVVPAVAP